VNKGTGLFAKDKVEIAARVDVYIVVMHGLNGEDGTLQGLLELAGVPYTSTGVAGSALGMDKIMMKQFFRGADLPVLPGLWFTRSAYRENSEKVIREIVDDLGFPVFVKPANLGSSIGVSRADNADELADSLDLAFEYDRRVLVEKGLDKPIELNCSVLGYDDEAEASPIEMPINSDEFLDFKDKYLASGGSKGMASLHRVLPAPIEDELRDEIQKMSVRIFRLLDCKGVVRIDYMFDRASERIYITEINTIPGSLAFYLWENAGLSYTRLIDRMIEYAEKAHADKNAANYAYTSDILNGVSFGTKGVKGSKGSKGIKSAK
jgi:D-alanine-D-alanine ligase